MKQKMLRWKKWIMGTGLALLIVAASLQYAGAATTYKYGSFAVTALTSTSVSVDFRNVYYDTIKDGATVLGYKIYLTDSTAATGEQLRATANSNQIYGTLSGLTAGHNYSVKVEVEYQYAGTTPGTVPYYVYFTTPSAGASADVDVVDTTSVPSVTQQPGVSPTPSGTLQQLEAPSVQTVKMVGSEVGVLLNSVVCDGYEYGIYNKKTNALVRSSSSTLNSTRFYALGRKTVYYVRARAYAYDSNGTRVYSEWGKKKFFVPQPEIKKSASKLKKNSVLLKWGKVTGASKYTIYMRKRGGGKWSKVKTVKGKKSSCKITRYKGKGINTHKTNFEIKIKASAKIGGKTYNSTTNNYIYTYTYTRYRY